MENKHTKEDLKMMQAWPLERKIQVTQTRFMGSGTTAKMALLNNRNYIGFELDTTYCDIANERIQKAMQDKGVGE